MFDPKLKEALGRVQKPGRYTGGEPGSIYKEKDKVDVRFAFWAKRSCTSCSTATKTGGASAPLCPGWI